jgi:hypothetical protein
MTDQKTIENVENGPADVPLDRTLAGKEQAAVTIDEIAESKEQSAETVGEIAESRSQKAETTDETAEAVTRETAADVSPTEAEMPRDPRLSGGQDIAPIEPGLQDDPSTGSGQAGELAEAGILARLKMKLKDMLIAARRKKQEKMAANLETIMAYAREHGKVMNNEVENLVKVKDRQATRYLAELVKQGRLMRFGTKRNIFYKPVE